MSTGASAGRVIRGEELAAIRHDLRTPVNHILGYCEMLIEDAEEAAPDTVEALSAVRGAGRGLLQAIDDTLADSPSGVTPSQFQAFSARTSAIIAEILAKCAETRTHATALPQWGADLDKIAGAARRFAEMATGNFAVPQAAPAPPPVEVAPAEATPAPAPAVPRDKGTRPQAQLLIVEDNPDNRDVLRRRLEREGHAVHEAENGAAAIEKLRARSYDLVLLDILMPVMNGYEVLTAMKADPELREIPIIMISALGELQSVVRCIEAGAEDYLPKPFDPVLLRARIGASLEKKWLRDAERERTRELEETLRKLRETQAQLIVQEKMASLGALTAGIAHEIKNPLNFVTNFAELSIDLLGELKEEIGRGGPVDDLLADLSGNADKIRHHGRRADSIVRGMLMHSRGSSGQFEEADLNAVLDQAATLAYHGLRAKDSSFNVTIEKHYAEGLPKVQIVPQDLSRVFLNIVNNACYASHEKTKTAGSTYRPTLMLTTRDAGDRIEVRIADNGPGIPPAVLDKIFNPFFTTKPTGEGTGLGLSISHQIVVEQHKGTIQVESREGEGTEFRIAVPK
jgi:two-component system, NtrC family, sensor kinase